MSFGVGTFAGADGVAFPGLVVDEHVRDLRPDFTDTFAMLQDWDATLARLHELAAQPADGEPLVAVRPLPPVHPSGQVLCAGANHGGRWLRPGDVMEGEITGLGCQRNPCIAPPA